jgi:DNA modification methylase
MNGVLECLGPSETYGGSNEDLANQPRAAGFVRYERDTVRSRSYDDSAFGPRRRLGRFCGRRRPQSPSGSPGNGQVVRTSTYYRNVPSLTLGREPEIAYETAGGVAWLGDAIETLEHTCDDNSVDLIVTSPPFALQRPKEYGNESQGSYRDWFLPFADEFWRVLKPSGSLVIDLGGAWEAGYPVKSLYSFELLVTLCRRPTRSFFLAQDFYWYNPARLPSPAQWVTIERVRAKDAVNTVWWLSKSQHPKADNRRVLREYTDSMKRLIDSGTYNRGRRPSGHVVREGFTEDRGGAIPPNLLSIPNTGNDKPYLDACKRLGVKPHPARFAPEVPEFFIRFLTDVGDHVVDPFAGSNVTGQVAEALGRRWLSVDLEPEYVRGSAARFENLQPELVTSSGD